jgi:hypothetical protein
VIIGYEVDLNLKNEERYQSTIDYYQNGLKPQLVVWLVRNRWIMDKICSLISQYNYSRTNFDFSKRCVFVLLDDFKENIWEAKIVSAAAKGESLRKVHANLIQRASKREAKLNQKPMRDIFFPKFKSPQKSDVSVVLKEEEKTLTPFGLRGEVQMQITKIENIKEGTNQSLISDKENNNE